MKVSAAREELMQAIQLAERLTGKKESLPVLSCVLIEANGSLVVRATNLEAGIEITVPATIEDHGVIAVPASVLTQTLRGGNSDVVVLHEVDGNLSVEAKGSRSVIKATPHEEFPRLTHAKDGGFQVSRERLLNGLQSVLYAASPSMIRPELGSVSITLDGTSMTCVATDSFRLAEKNVPGATKGAEGDLLIPLKHAQELSHVLDRLDVEVVTVHAEETQFSLDGGGVRFVSRLVDASFPNYREIIPKSFTTEATLLKADLAEMLRKARVFSGDEQHVGLHLYPKKKIFSATARSAAVGEMSDDISAALSGDDLDINFHIGYLADCLSSVQSDSVALSFAGPGRPLVVRGTSDQSFMYLVMPLNR